MPHRAHVHGRRPPAEDAGDDHGAHRARAPRRAGRAAAAAAAATSRACSRRCRAGRSRSACSTRRCTSSCPTAWRWRSVSSSARDEQAESRAALEQELDLVLRLGEVNPMLGTRGCRLGIVHPEIYEMQVEAIMRAARAAATPPRLEIMIPLVDFEAELAELRAMVVRIGDRHGLREGTDYLVGTMIELPRACFIADRLAARGGVLLLRHQRPHADGARVLARRRRGRLRPEPTSSAASSTARRSRRSTSTASARSSRPPSGWAARGARASSSASAASTAVTPTRSRFFHRAGLDYVSCSPFRLPIARVAAAQAALS